MKPTGEILAELNTLLDLGTWETADKLIRASLEERDASIAELEQRVKELTEAIKKVDYPIIASFSIRVNEDYMYSNSFRVAIDTLCRQIHGLKAILDKESS